MWQQLNGTFSTSYCIALFNFECNVSEIDMNIVSIITARKRSLGQGNSFTPVCHSVHWGGAWSWGGLLPGGCLLRGGCLLLGGPGGDPPWTATTAGGTNPTGMHSCYTYTFEKIDLLRVNVR